MTVHTFRPRKAPSAALALVVAGVAIGVVAVPATPAEAAAPSGYTLAYSDEFSGTTLNENAWFYRITGPYTGGYMTKGNVSVSGGSLHLRFDRKDVTGDGVNDYVGGGVMTRQNLGYGYYEVRARLYSGTPGLHTSFWSMGLRKDIGGGGGDPRINQDVDAGLIPENNQLYEIDGFEHDSPNSISMGTIHQDGSPGASRFRPTEASLGVEFGDWNVYGYEYTPQSVVFTVNGTVVGTAPTISPTRANPMNFWLTALPYYASAGDATVAGESEFDYFRYYNRPLSGVNLLGNADLETASPVNPGNWVVPGWIEWGNKPASELITNDGHSGTRSFQQRATADPVTTKQNLTNIPNGTYDARAWVKGTGGLTSTLRVLGHGGTTRTLTIPASSTWQQIVIPDVVVTSGSATIAVTSVGGTTGQWLRVDDVSFTLQ